MHLYLIRHPKPDVAPGICYGRSDLPLADPGALPALASELRTRIPADASLFFSPAERCLHLAALLHPQPQVDARLWEMDFGRWEGQHWDRIPRQEIDAWASDPLGYRPPEGESVSEMAARVDGWLESVGQLPAVVVVAHGGPIRRLIGRIEGLAFAEWSRIEIAFGQCRSLEMVTAAE